MDVFWRVIVAGDCCVLKEKIVFIKNTTITRHNHPPEIMQFALEKLGQGSKRRVFELQNWDAAHKGGDRVANSRAGFTCKGNSCIIHCMLLCAQQVGIGHLCRVGQATQRTHPFFRFPSSRFWATMHSARKCLFP